RSHPPFSSFPDATTLYLLLSKFCSPSVSLSPMERFSSSHVRPPRSISAFSHVVQKMGQNGADSRNSRFPQGGPFCLKIKRHIVFHRALARDRTFARPT